MYGLTACGVWMQPRSLVSRLVKQSNHKQLDAAHMGKMPLRSRPVAALAYTECEDLQTGSLSLGRKCSLSGCPGALSCKSGDSLAD